MSLTYEALEDCIVMIKDGWTAGTQLPNIKALWKEKSAGFMDDRRDMVLVYPRRENIDYFGLYGSDFLHHVDIQIECWTYMNQDRLDDLVKEVTKIIKNNIRRTDFVDLMITGSISASDTYRNIWKHVLTAKYRKVNPE